VKRSTRVHILRFIAAALLVVALALGYQHPAWLPWILVGALFALNNFSGIGFDKTWPVLLIVFGLLSLLRRSMEPPPPPPPPPPPVYPPPGYGAPPPAATYAASSYSQPSTAKGGFGGTAPARPNEASGNQQVNPDSGDTV
jgi:hypothetical protein